MDRRIFCFAIVISGLCLAGCGLFTKNLRPYRYRLTVEVDTPEGLRTGSSVIEVHTRITPKTVPDANTLSLNVVGEAVTVDLGGRGMLFALLRGNSSLQWAGGVMELVTPHPPNVPGEDSYIAWHERMIANKGLHVLPRNSPGNSRRVVREIAGSKGAPHGYPMLVCFGDIANPTTVRLVDPDDLGKSFGTGVHLRKITVQLTDDPVTIGIEKRLRWLSAATDGGLDKTTGVSATPTLAQQLSFLDFRRN